MNTNTEKQTLEFQAEVKQVLKLVIHSMYSNKEIVIRELVSNASDALDKVRYLSLSDPNLLGQDTDLVIHIEIDKEARTIRVSDNGVGMSLEETKKNLGTIAESGTQQFLAALADEQARGSTQLIGQFGVGFYSAFIIADRVVVNTRRAGLPPDQGVSWESTGDGEYTIQTIHKATRGTEVILHLREAENEYLEDWYVRGNVRKYSDHIMYRIMMKEVPLPKSDAEKEGDKTEEVAADKWEVVNHATALWTLPKSEIKDEEYQAFYKHIAHDFDDPLLWSHNRVEGKQEYTTLLYVPSHAPFDLFNNYEKPRGLKLYVKRVFIMDDAEQLLPRYLRFVKGIVDSSDLPLNVSRELLQDNRLVDTIRSSTTKRLLDILTKLAGDDKEKYAQFWREFGNTLKEGIVEDFTNRPTLAKLLRFSSTHQCQAEQTVSLEDYVKRMLPDQKKIYYLTADSFANAQHSPHLEIFRKKGIEVLLLSDRIDEWWVGHLQEFDEKPLQSVAKGEVDLGDEKQDEAEKQEEQQIKDDMKGLTDHMKEVLGDKVKEVRVSHRLTESPVCIVTDENTLSTHMQRILKAAGQAVPESKPILELNPKHRLVQRLQNEQEDEQFARLTLLLFEQALLIEGGQLEDPAGFVQRLNQLLVGVAP